MCLIHYIHKCFITLSITYRIFTLMTFFINLKFHLFGLYCTTQYSSFLHCCNKVLFVIFLKNSLSLSIVKWEAQIKEVKFCKEYYIFSLELNKSKILIVEHLCTCTEISEHLLMEHYCFSEKLLWFIGKSFKS